MSNIQKNIKDLIFFYVKTNYENYLKQNNIQSIPENQIDSVIKNLYLERKKHIQEFIINALKQMHSNNPNEYPGDQTIKNILLNIFQEDEYCQNRLILEIKLYQQKGNVKNYSKLL